MSKIFLCTVLAALLFCPTSGAPKALFRCPVSSVDLRISLCNYIWYQQILRATAGNGWTDLFLNSWGCPPLTYFDNSQSKKVQSVQNWDWKYTSKSERPTYTMYVLHRCRSCWLGRGWFRIQNHFFIWNLEERGSDSLTIQIRQIWRSVPHYQDRIKGKGISSPLGSRATFSANSRCRVNARVSQTRKDGRAWKEPELGTGFLWVE